MDNANSPEYLAKIRNGVIENLSRTKFAPSAQMQDIPRDLPGMGEEAEDELDDLDEDENKDVRNTQRRWDRSIERDDELDPSEDEAENKRNGISRPRDKQRRMNIMDYQNPNAVPDVLESGMATPLSSAAGDKLPPTSAPRSEGSDDGSDVYMDGAGTDAIDQARLKNITSNPSVNGSTELKAQASNGSADVEMADAESDAGEPAAASLEAEAIKEEAKEEKREEEANAEAATEFVAKKS